MKYCIKFLLISLFITSCAGVDSGKIAPNYFTAFSMIKGSILGFEDYPITRELVNSIPYASIKLKIGKGSAGLLILEDINDKNLVYLSSDDVRIIIRNGKIIRTTGFDHNLIQKEEPRELMHSFLKSAEDSIEYYTYHSYDDPPLNQLRIKVQKSKIGFETVNILGIDLLLLRIEEKLYNEYLGWQRTNNYWVDENSFVWKSDQYISPLLPKISFEITKKPTL